MLSYIITIYNIMQLCLFVLQISILLVSLTSRCSVVSRISHWNLEFSMTMCCFYHTQVSATQYRVKPASIFKNLSDINYSKKYNF